MRGYRQDLLLADNGLFTSIEVRLPVLEVADWQSVLSVAPFFDFGTVWNQGELTISPSTLASIGLGLRWQQGDNFQANIYWGLPLIDIAADRQTLQENGIYFSLRWNAF